MKGTKIEIATLANETAAQIEQNNTNLYNKLILTAARQGNIKLIQQMLDKGVDVNATNEDGVTPLFLAAQNGHLQAVKFLLSNKATIDAVDIEGLSPLYIAAQQGRYDVVEELLRKGAKENLMAADGNTALHIAAQQGHTDIVNLLIRNGAVVNATNQENCTALYLAAYAGKTDTVKVLLDNKASLTIGDQLSGYTPAYVATMQGHIDVLKLLVARGYDVNYDQGKGVKDVPGLLFVAAENGHKDCVDFLLDKGAKIDEDFAYMTPLYAAINSGHEDLAEYLLSRGANIQGNVLSEQEQANRPLNPVIGLFQSLLHTAVYQKNADAIKFLVKHGADLLAKTQLFGITALDAAFMTQAKDMVQILIALQKKYKFIKDPEQETEFLKSRWGSARDLHLAITEVDDKFKAARRRADSVLYAFKNSPLPTELRTCIAEFDYYAKFEDNHGDVYMGSFLENWQQSQKISSTIAKIKAKKDNKATDNIADPKKNGFAA